MDEERKKLENASALQGMTAHFGTVQQLSEREDISATIDRIDQQAKKLSAATHRQLVMDEGKSVGTAVNMLLEQVDSLLTERRSYNDFLRKRTENWDLSAKHLKQINEKPDPPECSDMSCDKLTISVNTGDSSRSFNSSASASRSHSSIDLQVLSAPQTSDEVERKEPEMLLPKRPKLADYSITRMTMDAPPKVDFAKMEVPKAPALSKYQFQSSYPGEHAGGAFPTPQRPVLTKVAELPKMNVHGSFEKHEIADHRSSNDGSKRSAGSMSGSFLDDYAVNDYGIVPNVGPLVRSDLGFNDRELLEESTLSSFGGLPSSLLKRQDRTEESIVVQPTGFKKPTLPTLKTITLSQQTSQK